MQEILVYIIIALVFVIIFRNAIKLLRKDHSQKNPMCGDCTACSPEERIFFKLQEDCEQKGEGREEKSADKKLEDSADA